MVYRSVNLIFVRNDEFFVHGPADKSRTGEGRADQDRIGPAAHDDIAGVEDHDLVAGGEIVGVVLGTQERELTLDPVRLEGR